MISKNKCPSSLLNRVRILTTNSNRHHEEIQYYEDFGVWQFRDGQIWGRYVES